MKISDCLLEAAAYAAFGALLVWGIAQSMYG
jgi:hypothetical protein